MKFDLTSKRMGGLTKEERGEDDFWQLQQEDTRVCTAIVKWGPDIAEEFRSPQKYDLRLLATGLSHEPQVGPALMTRNQIHMIFMNFAKEQKALQAKGELFALQDAPGTIT